LLFKRISFEICVELLCFIDNSSLDKALYVREYVYVKLLLFAEFPNVLLRAGFPYEVLCLQGLQLKGERALPPWLQNGLEKVSPFGTAQDQTRE
jgi:hypothetical protein